MLADGKNVREDVKRCLNSSHGTVWVVANPSFGTTTLGHAQGSNLC